MFCIAHNLVLLVGEPGGGDLVESMREKLRREQQLVIQLEKDLQNRETALQLARYHVLTVYRYKWQGTGTYAEEFKQGTVTAQAFFALFLHKIDITTTRCVKQRGDQICMICFLVDFLFKKRKGRDLQSKIWFCNLRAVFICQFLIWKYYIWWFLSRNGSLKTLFKNIISFQIPVRTQRIIPNSHSGRSWRT